MQLSFLVRGKDTKGDFPDKELPDGMICKCGRYKADDTELFFIEYEFARKRTLLNARRLAAFRDELPSNNNVKLLADDASAIFWEKLYPYFARFECKFRTVLIIASCAEQGNFDDKKIAQLNRLTLGDLRAVLFTDLDFMKAAREGIKSAKSSFNKRDLFSFIDRIEEHTLWDDLFGESSLTCVAESFDAIKGYRNDVMHFHTMDGERYDEARRLLRAATAKIEEYISSVLSNVDYPEQKAEGARRAAKRLDGAYWKALAASLENFQKSEQVQRMNAVAAALSERMHQYESLAKIAEAAKVNVPELPSLNNGISFADALNMSKVKPPDNYLDTMSGLQNVSRDLSTIAGATKIGDFFQPDMGLAAVQTFSELGDADSVEDGADREEGNSGA